MHNLWMDVEDLLTRTVLNDTQSLMNHKGDDDEDDDESGGMGSD